MSRYKKALVEIVRLKLLVTQFQLRDKIGQNKNYIHFLLPYLLVKIGGQNDLLKKGLKYLGPKMRKIRTFKILSKNVLVKNVEKLLDRKSIYT